LEKDNRGGGMLGRQQNECQKKKKKKKEETKRKNKNNAQGNDAHPENPQIRKKPRQMGGEEKRLGLAPGCLKIRK